MIRQCRKCNTTKPLDQFYKRGSCYRTECKSCWALKNKNAYQGEQREKRLATNKRHKDENPEYYKKYHQKHYQDNREKFLTQRAERYTQPAVRARSMISAAKKHAGHLNLPFKLSFERVLYALIVGKCERTGINFDFTPSETTWRNANAPSIDRRNSFEGYTDENVQIVVTLYNYGKGQHTDDEFIEFCHRVAERNPRKREIEK